MSHICQSFSDLNRRLSDIRLAMKYNEGLFLGIAFETNTWFALSKKFRKRKYRSLWFSWSSLLVQCKNVKNFYNKLPIFWRKK